MEPVKAFFPLSTWLLRLAILVVIYILFFTALRTFNVHNANFWFAVGFTLCGILLFIGGFFNKSTMTVVTAWLLLLGCIYKLVMHYAFDKGSIAALYFVFAALALFFISIGNKKK